MFDLNQATGLTAQELAAVFQKNPRAYMAVRGAVAEKHLEKVIVSLKESGTITDFRIASGDMDKDFYLNVDNVRISVECKNVEVIKTNNRSSILSYIEFLMGNSYLTAEQLRYFLRQIGCEGVPLAILSSENINKLFKLIPQEFRESGLAKYQHSSMLVSVQQLGLISDFDFLSQFERFPISIDFQRTRNSTDEEGDTRRNRYYRVGEIDIVAACLFSRTMRWEFVYAKAAHFEMHRSYMERYSNRLVLKPGIWTSDLTQLLRTRF